MNTLVIHLVKVPIYLMIFIGIICCSEEKEVVDDPILEPGIIYDTFSDNRDGQIYHSIQIGNQFWMAENLAYRANEECWAYENEEKNVSVYGYLYSWETACNVCPEGWHLPSSAEFDTLISYLGGSTVAGGKMKRTGTSYWNSPNTGATNSSGLTALSGGIRYSSEGGWFDNKGDFTSFWSSSEYQIYYAWFLSLHNSSGHTGSILSTNGLDWCGKDYGYSVRCVKD